MRPCCSARPFRTSVPPIEVSAEELAVAYAGNEVAADNRYKGRILEVGGIVETIGKDILGEATIALSTQAGLGVSCALGKQLQREIASLRPGQAVVIRGRCKGSFLGGPLLSDCSPKSYSP